MIPCESPHLAVDPTLWGQRITPTSLVISGEYLTHLGYSSYTNTVPSDLGPDECLGNDTDHDPLTCVEITETNSSGDASRFIEISLSDPSHDQLTNLGDTCETLSAEIPLSTDVCIDTLTPLTGTNPLVGRSAPLIIKIPYDKPSNTLRMSPGSLLFPSSQPAQQIDKGIFLHALQKHVIVKSTPSIEENLAQLKKTVRDISTGLLAVLAAFGIGALLSKGPGMINGIVNPKRNE